MGDILTSFAKTLQRYNKKCTYASTFHIFFIKKIEFYLLSIIYSGDAASFSSKGTL